MRTIARRARDVLKRKQKAISRRLSRPHLYDLDSAERVGVVFKAPSDMRIDERIFLYALVRGLRPQRALEVGILQGGGGAIMANAMEENGRGSIIGLDPDPNITVRERDFHGRYKVLRRPSPEGVAEAAAMAGGAFDFVLIDGLHRYDQVRQDIDAVKQFLASDSYVLFHDAFHYGVAEAIKEAVAADERWIDCGYVCQTARIDNDPFTPYNGFRLLRFGPAKVVDAFDVVSPIYAEAGKTAPVPSRDMLDHDGWFCRKIEPCAKCVATGRNTKAKSNGDGKAETAQTG
jgi:predicted O-methyltransferase YrrM